MSDDPNKREDARLDALFAEARRDRPKPTTDFMARLRADAEAHAVTKPNPVAAPKMSRSSLGRWFAGLSLAGATAAGIIIGMTATDTLNTLFYGEDGTDLILASNEDGFILAGWSE